MERKIASMSFWPRRDVGSMRGAQSSILGSMKWTVQVRRAAITVRHHVHFNSGVLRSLAAARSLLAREVPRPTAASARRSEHDSAAAVVGSDGALALNVETASWKVKVMCVRAAALWRCITDFYPPPRAP